MNLEQDRIAGLDVSRETIDAMRQLEALVCKWTPAINLVSRATVADLWTRHIVDSAQVFLCCPKAARKWLDLGSGGGFPGIVIAILARELASGLRVTLVEADKRKATFLRQAVQSLNLDVEVKSERIEALSPQCADVVSARALASLVDLLGHANKHMRPEGVAIFPKGARHAEELAEARLFWDFDVEVQPSLSDAGAAIIVIRNIHRADHA